MDFLKLLSLLLQPVATVINLTTAPPKKTGNDSLTNPPTSDKLFSTIILLGLLASFGLTSCSSTSQLRIKVLQPSKVTVGDRIKTIALVNRTKPENTKANVVEGILTGEGLYEDKSGVTSAFGGLNDGLRNSPRFQIKQTNLLLPGSGTGVLFPAPMSWEEVDRICSSYQADAICAIETYDTDVQIIPGFRILDSKEGGLLKRTQFTANLRANVKIGFRLYDPGNKSIQDEYRFTHELAWTSGGLTPQNAVTALIEKRAATDRVSYVIGEWYAARIAPSWITVEREYYKRGKKPEMSQAYRMAYVNDWQGAAFLWETIANSSSRKTAGRAAYNRAIAAEVMGNLEEAKAWVSKAYVIYGNKKAKQYSQILDRRMFNNQQLDKQMRSVAGTN